MPQSPAQSDLFQESTMTFGQHLEELRTCLFRAIVGLAVGCVAGFLVGHQVVAFITKPVENALRAYLEQEAANNALSPKTIAQLREAGYTNETDLKRFQDNVAKENVSFDIEPYDATKLSSQLPVSADVASLKAEVATLKAEIDALKKTPSSQLPTGAQTDASPKIAPDDGSAESGSAEDQGFKKTVHFKSIANDPGIHMNAMGAQEAFVIWMKASMLVGIVLASPWVFYQIWTFVAAGLYPHERRYVHLFLPVSIGLFLAGASTAFFFAFKQVLTFLLGFNHMLHINPELRINEWMGFVLLLPLGFGISFQLPLVMLFLERIGLMSVKTYLSSWRMAVLVIFVLAMILTPTGDPYTMLLMAGPLTILYFGGVLLCKVLPKAKSRFAEQE